MSLYFILYFVFHVLPFREIDDDDDDNDDDDDDFVSICRQSFIVNRYVITVRNVIGFSVIIYVKFASLHK